MLETKELYKVYKPKKGVAVTAINKISLKFPEKGMIFLLGKSGSGKSTLLNLLGGLDKYDSGEIIIKGVSSKDFNQQHFDSYRNTYVGFIFQEYNILDEFSVGANIALALELQGKKATDEEINHILKEVDLDGYGNRKPNELSGGQKQRVAIARALVKNPEIIMADEPTGALDSNTGRQVFDTLKKLSQNKLIIIVSHDREFSELYADRIIELSDGNVISDVEIDAQADEEEKKGNLRYQGATIELAPGYHLTEEDRAAINAYIDRITDSNLNLKLTGNGMAAKKFIPTNQDSIKQQDGSSFQLIKSKLPLKSAFKIGASGLKYKKFRLVMTILLSCISFGLFGLADTFGSYKHIDACTNSLIDTGVDYVSLVKAIKQGEGINSYYNSRNTSITKEELEEIEKNTSIDMMGVFVPLNSNLEFLQNYDVETEFSKTDYNIYASGFSGYTEITQKKLDEFGYKILAGALPDGTKDEIAISAYVYETFKLGKYTDGTTSPDGRIVYKTIQSPEDLIGKTLNVNGIEYTITGIVDTNMDLERYKPLMEEKTHMSTADQIVNFALMNEFGYEANSSLARIIMVGEGYLSKLIENEPHISPLSSVYVYYYSSQDDMMLDPSYMCKLSDVSSLDITWFDGEKSILGEKEIVITSDIISSAGMGMPQEDYDNLLKNVQKNSFHMNTYGNGIDFNENEGYKVVGIIEINEKNSKYSGTVVANDKDFEYCIRQEKGDYNFVIGAMPESREDIKNLVAFCYKEDADIQFQLQNAVTYELDTINEMLKVLSKVFLYVGIGFALFASLMLANFIGTSISHKKQEIGILRAIGSRSNDVFRIFFSESFIIAMINFLLSAVGVFVATSIINAVIRKELGVLITVLNFGLRQILLLFVVSLFVATLASFLPVKKIASKKPIDAIRNR